MKKILLIDNYDSFSYTIVFYLKELGYQCKIIKNDEFKKAKDLARFDFSHLIISPGPNSPTESKLSLKAIQYFKKDKKILGNLFRTSVYRRDFWWKNHSDALPYAR